MAKPNIKPILKILKECPKNKNLNDFLEEHTKMKELGSGYFSSVYKVKGHPKLVLKVARDSNTYYRYVTWATRTKSKHAPKVYWKKKISEKTSVYIMEKLKESKGKERNIVRRTGEYFWDMDFPKKDKKNESLYNFLKKLRKEFGDEGAWDLHQNNMMLRGETIVVTDPIAG